MHRPSAVTIIPFTLLWGVRIPLRRKLAFTGLFSLTLVTIAAAIARAIETDVTKKANGAQDPSYVWMWGTIQASVGRSQAVTSKRPRFTKLAQQPLLSRVSRPSPSSSLRRLARTSPNGRRRKPGTSDLGHACKNGTQGRRIRSTTCPQLLFTSVIRRLPRKLLLMKVNTRCCGQKLVRQQLNAQAQQAQVQVRRGSTKSCGRSSIR